jgi:YcaO-like protein with predicted kinase domain
MVINNYVRNKFRRVADPLETLSLLRKGLKNLDLHEKVTKLKSCEHLWSANLEIPEIRAFSNGKGVSEIEATVSAYAEMVERLSAGMETGIKIGEFRQMYGDLGNLLAEITLFKYMKGYRWTHQDSIIQNVARVESFLKDYKFVPAQYEHMKFNSELLRHWIPGYSLIQDKEVYVPILFVKWISSTNGLAAGNTIEEAIIHGACEIFERDAMIKDLRFTNKRISPNIDLTSVDDETIQESLRYFKDNNVGVVAKDIGQGIYPVYSIMTFNRNLPVNHLGYNMMKAGSSFDSIEALTRCLTERMQGTHFDFEASQGLISTGTEQDKYMPMFFKGVCPFDLRRHISDETIPFEHKSINGTKIEIDRCIEIAKKLETDLIFIDHTHPVFNFPVARVIMPGISDFIKWWDPKQVTLNLIGNLEPEESRYEEKLKEVLRSFRLQKHTPSGAAKNLLRRDT